MSYEAKVVSFEDESKKEILDAIIYDAETLREINELVREGLENDFFYYDCVTHLSIHIVKC